jgi:Holliday junction resolvasome RuvABC DNA-binding subunit
MVLELKDKIKHLIPSFSEASPTAAAGPGDVEDVVSALVGLGYKKPQAEETVRKIKDGRPDLTIEELIREALSVLLKR